MQSMRLGKIGLTILVLGVMGSSGIGCAEERDPINRTQPNISDKSFFLGADISDSGFADDPEFRTKSFNIDSAANTENFAGTIGGASAVERVRWEVTEHYLFARRSYQESPGADNRGLPRKYNPETKRWEFPTKATGTIVAAFEIESHFDIRRDYNPQTGEEGNVIVENTSDRPWHQRQYMRVKWGKNVAKSTSGDTSWVFGSGSLATPIEYNVTNPDDEDAPKFEAEYFDVTNKYQLEPEPLWDFGVPECVIIGFYNGSTSFDCTPTEVKVRHSFERLTGNEDFEPFEESMAHRDIVGNWGNAGNSFNREYGAPPITAWDPQYGYTDAKTKTFFAHHNLWMKSHQDATCNNNVDSDKDGTADECSNGKTGYGKSTGSQCDIHIGRCTIPVRDRQVRTMGYWLNADAPKELQDEVSSDGKTVVKAGPIEDMTKTWNQLLKVAVATRREVECRRTGGGSRDECHAQFFEGTGPEAKDMVAFGGWGIDRTKALAVDKDETKGHQKDVVVTCHNPVRSYDDPICGSPDEKIRLGDVRKNYAIYWPYASRAPYGGVASIGADPLTGEMVGVTATTMMRSATIASAQQRDIIQIALGDLKVEDLIEGVQAQRYADSIRSGRISTEAMTKAKTPAQLAAAVRNLDRDSIQAQGGAVAERIRQLPEMVRRLERAKLDAKASPQTASIAASDQRLQALVDQLNSGPTKEYTPDLANRGLQRLLAQSKDKSSSVYTAIAKFASMDPSKIQDLFDRYQAYLGNRGICFHDSLNTAGAGSIYQPSLAPYFWKMYGGLDPKTRGEKIYNDLLREALKGISFHEIGHSLGMRHNFASSWDSQNYQPQYWQLRTNEGQGAKTCDPNKANDPATCMGPRYIDPMTDDEQGLNQDEPRPGLEYFANTSTMEYQIERFGETAGAGTYDLHFMKTVYGRSLETFDETQVPPSSQQYFALKMLSQGIPSDLVLDPQKGYGMHYTRAAGAAKVFDPARDCRPATPKELEDGKWRIVHGKVCAPPPKNHLAYEDMISSEISFKIRGEVIPIGVNGVRWSGIDENGQRLVRWPYRYGEDYSRGGYTHAKMMDSGADIYEITVNTTRRYDLTYPWTYFRRLSKEFAWWSIPSTVAGNVFSRLRGYHWSTTTDIARANVQDGDLDSDDKDRPAVMASEIMFNFLQRVITTPEPGVYGTGPDTTRRTSTRPGAQQVFDLMPEAEIGKSTPAATIGIIDGRYVQVDFDNDRGGSWDYFNYPKYTGFDEEKVLAIREMVDSRPTLSTVSRDNALDGRDPYISFRTDVPHALDRLMGSLLAEDWETVAQSALPDGRLETFSLLERDPARLGRPAGAKIIFPNMGYQNELGAAFYAMIFSRMSTDMTLANKLRIRLDGDAGAKIPDSKKAAFTDPVTGHRYMATRFGTENIQGRPVETGIASRMVERANELLSQAYEVRTQEGGVVMNQFGEPELMLANGKPISKGQVAEQALRRYIGFLDALRQVGNLYGGGPLGWGGGE